MKTYPKEVIDRQISGLLNQIAEKCNIEIRYEIEENGFINAGFGSIRQRVNSVTGEPVTVKGKAFCMSEAVFDHVKEEEQKKIE